MTGTGRAPAGSVVVADARPVVAAGLAAALDGRCRLSVTAASTEAELRAAIDAGPPGVVLVPVGRDGGVPGLLRCATRAAPDGTAVVVVGGAPGVADGSGGRVRAVLPAALTAAELARTVAALAAAPDVVVPAPTAPADPDGQLDPSVARPELASLTAREREVLDLLAHGRSTQEIAAAMSVTTNTVRTHVNVVLHKLGVHSRLRAVALFTDADVAGGAPPA